jgi:hypothetical protein
VLREQRGVARRLRAAVNGDLEPPARRLDERRADLLPLLRREEHALARRPEDERPIELVAREEVHIRRHGGGVERAVPERRHGRSERPA